MIDHPMFKNDGLLIIIHEKIYKGEENEKAYINTLYSVVFVVICTN